MFVVKITYSYTLGVPLNILPGLAADFDGDVLNIMYINNKQFFEACYKVFNPRNAMMISRNDGKFNSDVNWTKDTLINANGMLYLSRKYYTPEQLQRIEMAKRLE